MSPRTLHAPRSTLHAPRAFTLIELMIVVAIMGIVLTMGVPMVYKLWHRAPMQQAIKSTFEVLSNARARAILQNQTVEVVFHPRERRLELAGGSGSGLSAQYDDSVIIDLLDINMSGIEYAREEIARVKFHPNGTCDELKMILSSEREQLGIELEITTSLASVVPDPWRSWARR